MKKIISIGIISLTCIAGCGNEEVRCTKITELTDRNHLVDIKKLQGAPELVAVLAMYPQLQVLSGN